MPKPAKDQSMTDFNDDAYEVETAHRNRDRRRRQVVAGVAGLAAFLGVGAYFVTSQLTAKDQIAPEPAAIAPVEPAGSSSAPLSPGPSAAASAEASLSAAPVPAAGPSLPLTTAERVAKARAANKKAGTDVRHPLPQVGGAATVAEDDVTMKITGSAKDKEELRLYSARLDMTGQKQLAWVGDQGERVGDASCTKNVHFSADVKPHVRPTLLLCWRVSADKSVYTVAVNLDGHPSAAKSVAAIDKEWKRLG
jgi:hypothetical protein